MKNIALGSENRETRHISLYHGMASELPRTVVELTAYLNNLLREVPEEYRGEVEVDFAADDEWGVTYTTCSVSYTRPESDQEVSARLQREAEEREARRQQQNEDQVKREQAEWALYKSLKIKFESKEK